MRSYVEAQKVIATARKGARQKPLGNNTRLIQFHDCFCVQLHNTYVVSYYPDGSVVLNSGGWRTKTTKARMNDHLPRWWFVYQERGVWYLRKDMGLQEYIFVDGIRIGPRGGCSGKLRPKKKERKP